jgi:hypothetical protein
MLPLSLGIAIAQYLLHIAQLFASIWGCLSLALFIFDPRSVF